MTEVRRHQRQTASGKTATVRQHERNTGSGQAWADRVQETTQRSWQVPPPAERAEAPQDDGSWWDDEATPAGDWWAEEEKPVSEKPHAKPKTADPMDAAGKRNVAADKKVAEAKDEVRHAPRSGSPLTDTPEKAAARQDLHRAFDEQDAARAERAQVFERQMSEEAARRGVPAYESRFARWRRLKRDGR